MFITVTCCEEIAKKLFENFLQLFCVHVRITVSAVHIAAQQIPELSRSKHIFQVLEILQTQFQDFPGGMGTL